MVLETFTALVGLIAVVYAGIVKYIQNKMIDRSKIQDIQAQSKKLNEEFKRAKEKGNKKEMENVMKKQMEFLPQMNTVMMGQFKVMGVIMLIFFAFIWVVGEMDPSVQDDIKVTLADDGTGCDESAGDGTYSACIEPENSGKWVASMRSYRNGVEVGFNSTYFSYNAQIDDTYTENPQGEHLVASTDKVSYENGETVKLYAQAEDVSSVVASLDNATSFRVDLPLTIPVLNVQRIYQPYWWFILISLITNLTLSVVLGRLKK